jgi:protein tyrosine/serine phosphatase
VTAGSRSLPCFRTGAHLPAWVDLEGAVNVRDVGGLPLEGGGVTAGGVLIRSDNLQDLTERDVSKLVDELGVRVVVDLRSDAEVEYHGEGPLFARADVRHRSLYPEKGTFSDVMISRADGEDPFVRYYLAYLRDRPDSFVGALSDVAEGPGPVIIHCAAGKDRTGMVVALALAAVGVEREAIIADYALTGERIAATMARLRSSDLYRPDLEGVTDESRMPRPEYLTRVLEVIDSEHGGAAAWLAQHGFDPAALRERLVR